MDSIKAREGLTPASRKPAQRQGAPAAVRLSDRHLLGARQRPSPRRTTPRNVSGVTADVIFRASGLERGPSLLQVVGSYDEPGLSGFVKQVEVDAGLGQSAGDLT